MGIGVPEAIDELRVVSEMIIERGPLSCDDPFTTANSRGGRCSDVPNRTAAFGLKF